MAVWKVALAFAAGKDEKRTMKIKQVDLFAIELPLNNPFVVSYGGYNRIQSIIVKITTDNGIVGYGEAVPDMYVTGETVESTYNILAHTLAPSIIDENPLNIERIHDLMDEMIFGVSTAKAAIDIACYDVAGKSAGLPVYMLIGGRYRESMAITHVLSIDTPENMADEAARCVEAGYRSFKLKVGTEPLEDVKKIKAVRERVAEDIAIRIDVNQGWKNSATTLQILDKLAGLSIDWIEQPVTAIDIDAMVEIKSKSTIPMMMDEGLHSSVEMRQIISKRAADKVNIKLMKCGGIYPAVKLVHMAEMAGIECQIGSMVESSIGSAAGFHVAFSKKIITSAELTGPLKFEKDVGNLQYDIPIIKLNEQPGLGIDVNEDILQELTVHSQSITSKN